MGSGQHTAALCFVPKGSNPEYEQGYNSQILPREAVPTTGHGRQQAAESRALPQRRQLSLLMLPEQALT